MLAFGRFDHERIGERTGHGRRVEAGVGQTFRNVIDTNAGGGLDGAQIDDALVGHHAIAAGVPATFLKWRCVPDISVRIIRLAWWDWEHAELADAVEDMRLLSAQSFLAKYEGQGS